MEETPLGTKIKILRKRKKLTQIEVAKQLNVNAPTYCKYENNIHKPKEETLKEIAKILGVNLATFYDEDLFNTVTSHNVDELIDWSVRIYSESNVDENILLLKEILEKFNYPSHIYQTTISKLTTLAINTPNTRINLSTEEASKFYNAVNRYIELLLIEHAYNSTKDNITP